jgi:hypothetical protein
MNIASDVDVKNHIAFSCQFYIKTYFIGLKLIKNVEKIRYTFSN